MKRYDVIDGGQEPTYIEHDDGRFVKHEDVQEMREVLLELVDLMQGVIDGEYKPDSFTLQPAKNILGREGE